MYVYDVDVMRLIDYSKKMDMNLPRIKFFANFTDFCKIVKISTLKFLSSIAI